MPNAKKIPQLTLTVRRTFSAPREKIFAAWADPDQVKLWMFKDADSYRNVFHQNDIRPGGQYLVETHDMKQDRVYWGQGTYVEVIPPEKISYTWYWKLGTLAGPNNHPDSPDTTVTVEFFPRGNSTEVVLTHSVFHSQKDFDDHRQGWEGCLTALHAFLFAGH